MCVGQQEIEANQEKCRTFYNLLLFMVSHFKIFLKKKKNEADM